MVYISVFLQGLERGPVSKSQPEEVDISVLLLMVPLPGLEYVSLLAKPDRSQE